MNSEEVEKFLKELALKKNTLAQTYLSLLEQATPDMKDYWYQYLATMLVPILNNKKEIEEALKEGK